MWATMFLLILLFAVFGNPVL